MSWESDKGKSPFLGGFRLVFACLGCLLQFVVICKYLVCSMVVKSGDMIMVKKAQPNKFVVHVTTGKFVWTGIYSNGFADEYTFTMAESPKYAYFLDPAKADNDTAFIGFYKNTAIYKYSYAGNTYTRLFFVDTNVQKIRSSF